VCPFPDEVTWLRCNQAKTSREFVKICRILFTEQTFFLYIFCIYNYSRCQKCTQFNYLMKNKINKNDETLSCRCDHWPMRVYIKGHFPATRNVLRCGGRRCVALRHSGAGVAERYVALPLRTSCVTLENTSGQTTAGRMWWIGFSIFLGALGIQRSANGLVQRCVTAKSTQRFSLA